MSDEKVETYSFEKRKDGADKLAAVFTEAGIANEVIAEKGRTENFDSVRVRISRKDGVPTADFTINAKGWINVGYQFTDGTDGKLLAKATDLAEELQGAEVSAKFVKVKAAPGGSSFLGKL